MYETQQELSSAAEHTSTDFLSVHIPPRPALLLALQHEIKKDDPNTKKIADLISRDVAMAGSLLETTNSAFFNFKRRATSVHDVIAMMGMNHCTAIMSGLITKKTLGIGAMMMARFWDVSAKRAMGMSYLAKEIHATPPEIAYSFGLFCDIGIPLLKATFPAYLKTLSVANGKAAEEFLHVEDDQHGVNHAQIGAMLAERWTITPEVVQAIAMHHSQEVLYDESVDMTTRALVAMNKVVEKAIQQHRGETQSLEWLEGGAVASEALGISDAEVDALCDALIARFRG